MIRKATPDDLEKLLAIHNKVRLDRSQLGNPQYEAHIQKTGFLLGIDEPHSLEEELEGAYQFLVAEEDGEVKGFLIADHREEQKFYDDEYKTWFDLELKDTYYKSEKGMTVAVVAVDPDYAGKGIATEMLKHLEDQLSQEGFEYLFSIVTMAPLTNCSSLIWHTKNGFKRLAIGVPRKLFELDNYAAVLFYKKF